MKKPEVDPEKAKEEQNIIEELFQHIDSFEDVVFEAGAGSGKTFALIQCLKHVVLQNGSRLEQSNQKIMCITYTNVAADNIRMQLGNSKLVEVSTIHERVWKLIQGYHAELMEVHAEKIKETIQKEKDKLKHESCKDFEEYRDRFGSENIQNEFLEEMLKHKDEFYQSYDLKAPDFKAKFGPIVTWWKIGNVTNFRKLVQTLFIIEKHDRCLKRIERKEIGNDKVDYKPMYNRDKLCSFRISHDTLLEYADKMTRMYPRLCQVIMDRYPYIFIDEYQDTSESVVSIMRQIDSQSKILKRKFFVGYFGDPAQSIYEKGVGNKLETVHQGLNKVQKTFNRRSCQEVIDVANQVRNDSLIQQTIYKDFTGGNVKIILGSKEIESIYHEYEKCWEEDPKDDDSKVLHCFLMKNEEVAKYCGFHGLYECFKNAECYKGSKYSDLNSEFMSNDVRRLGKIQEKLYRILEFYIEIREERTPIASILYKADEQYRALNITELRNLLENLRSISGDTLSELLKSMEEKYRITTSYERNILEAVCDIEKVSYEDFVIFFIEIFGRGSQEEEIQYPKAVTDLLNIKISELIKWYHYVNRQYEGDIVYHTFHGTKGLEFDNVLIVLNNSFKNRKEYFKGFFDVYSKKTTDIDEKYIEVRNLLYVAVTRAKHNLLIQIPEDMVQEYGDMICEICGVKK